MVGRRVFGHRACSHSFNGKSRRWAAASIDGYLAGAGTEAIYEQERLTERDRYNEYLMTRLRTAEGLELATVETCFGKERAERLLRQAEPFMRSESCVSRPVGWRFRRRSFWCRMRDRRVVRGGRLIVE